MPAPVFAPCESCAYVVNSAMLRLAGKRTGDSIFRADDLSFVGCSKRLNWKLSTGGSRLMLRRLLACVQSY